MQTLNSELIRDIVDSMVKQSQLFSLTKSPEEKIDEKLSEIKKEGLRDGIYRLEPYVRGRTSALMFHGGGSEEEMKKLIEALIRLLEGATRGILGACLAIKERKEGFLNSALDDAFLKTEKQFDDAFRHAKENIFSELLGNTNTVKSGWTARL